MMNRSPESNPTDPTIDAIRDELPRDVLSYAEGLRREMYSISRRYGVDRPADIGPKMASGEVSLADMERMIELKTALEKAVAEKRIPFRMEAYREALAELGETFIEKGYRPEMIDRLPVVPNDQLLSNKLFMQEVMDAMGSSLPREKRRLLGVLVSRIMNRAVDTLPPELRGHVLQTVLSDGMNGLGYRWAGGYLSVNDEAGTNLGREMTAGTVYAKSAGAYAGLRMRGGHLKISECAEIDMLGKEMEGGEIEAVAAGMMLGEMMKGGKISVQTAGSNAGQEMTDGEIVIREHARNDLGKRMSGGSIRAAASGSRTGNAMRGGRIAVAEPGFDLGKEMEGGLIEAGDASSSSVGELMIGGEIRVETANYVGAEMTGGTIIVTEFAKYVGDEMKGGEIVLRGIANVIALLNPKSEFKMKRSGGIIRYEGPWAWWKNLWIR